MKLQVSPSRSIDFRVSTLPTLFGEKIVMRILDGSQAQLGIDPIQFATVVVVNLMIGMLHPPVGLLVLITAAIGRCSLWSVAWETLPFLAWSLLVLLLMSVFPGIVTALPNFVMGG